MTTFIVTFEISDPVRKAAIKKKFREDHASYCPIHDNAFAIKSEKTSTQIVGDLQKISVNPDRVFVIRSGTQASWTNAYGEKNSEWLKKNL